MSLFVVGRIGTSRRFSKRLIRGAEDQFGIAVSVSGDSVVVGAHGEDSNATRVNGNQRNNVLTNPGAAYVATGFCPRCPQLALARDGSGGYFLRFSGIPGENYQVLHASNPTGPWSAAATLTAPASGLAEFHDAAPLPGQAFYRVAQP